MFCTEFSTIPIPLFQLQKYNIFLIRQEKNVKQYYLWLSVVASMSTLSNNRLKSLATYRQQKNCEADNLFVVEGIKMAQEALKSGWHIRTICCTEEALNVMGPLASNVADELYMVSDEQMGRLSLLRSPQGVWMLVERRAEDLPRAGTPAYQADNGLVLALDGIQDPGNMGTILRTCDWFGVRKVLCSLDTVSCYNPKVVQATMGAVFRTQVEYCNLAESLVIYKEQGYTVYGAMLDGEDAFTAIQNHRVRRTSSALRDPQEFVPLVLVIGNEGHGISPEVASVIGHRLTIPNIGGTCESLNAAVATAILISGFFRI